MAFRSADFEGTNTIEGYGPGFFRVVGEVIRGGVLVVGETATPWGGLSDEAPLLALAGQVDVLFLGTGAEAAYAPRDLVARLAALKVHAEAMPSPQAARTYNVTRSEGRRVACALLPL